jgi:hypothetical protein
MILRLEEAAYKTPHLADLVGRSVFSGWRDGITMRAVQNVWALFGEYRRQARQRVRTVMGA